MTYNVRICDWQIVPNLIESVLAFAATNQCKCGIAVEWNEKYVRFCEQQKKRKRKTDVLGSWLYDKHNEMPATVVVKWALILLERDVESTVHEHRKLY